MDRKKDSTNFFIKKLPYLRVSFLFCFFSTKNIKNRNNYKKLPFSEFPIRFLLTFLNFYCLRIFKFLIYYF